MSVGAMSMMAGTTSKEVGGGKVLCLMNMITAEELMDAEEADGELVPSFLFAVTTPSRRPPVATTLGVIY